MKNLQYFPVLRQLVLKECEWEISGDISWRINIVYFILGWQQIFKFFKNYKYFFHIFSSVRHCICSAQSVESRINS